MLFYVVFPWNCTFTAFLKEEREEVGMKNLRFVGIHFKAELGCFFAEYGIAK